MVAVTVLLASLATLVAAKPSTRSVALVEHESRSSVPDGFSNAGAASADTSLNLRIALKPSNADGLHAALMDVSTPGNAKYGQHLSKEQVEEFVKPAQGAADAVQSFLSSNGINSSIISSAGDWLGFKASVKQANSLFGADFSTFTHLDTGVKAVRTLKYSVPQNLQSYIDFVHPTVTFPNPHGGLPVFTSPVKTPVSSNTTVKGPTGASVPSSCSSTITPACLQALYGIPTTAATESSNKLAVSGYIQQYANKADLKTFLGDYRTDISSSTSFTLKTLDGGSNSQSATPGTEANLDIQYTVGVATGVPVTFISVGDDYQDGDLEGFLDTINLLLGEDSPPQVLTTSYGQNEDTMSRSLSNKLCDAYAQLGSRGTSILFASGDGGVSGSQSGSCSKFVPTFPSGCPYMTSVGATTGISPEKAADFSSGGFSNYFGIPDYQASAVKTFLSDLGSTNKGKYNASGRGYPDVSAQGENVEIVVSGSKTGVAGTSCASPIFASVVSLLNDELISAGKSPLGFLNPFLYANASALNDVTSGDNPGCSTNGFSAVKGWDPVTGLGTPNYAALKKAAGL
ncbi:hypothetical protein PLICRDRAFT_55032 [Plicaturopsis crispa FD-325 SS-3]|nr:hypothetical protein PLICRDRAFT_55032 [Plicaturopsis crispa FD-325 SS-3]